jgi:hypothetical protein
MDALGIQKFAKLLLMKDTQNFCNGHERMDVLGMNGFALMLLKEDT